MRLKKLEHLRQMVVTTGSPREPEKHEIVVEALDVHRMVNSLEKIHQDGGRDPFSRYDTTLLLVSIDVFQYRVQDLEDGTVVTTYAIPANKKTLWPRP